MRLDQSAAKHSSILHSRISELPARLVFYLERALPKATFTIKSCSIRLIYGLAKYCWFCITWLFRKVETPIYLLIFILCIIASRDLVSSQTFQDWWINFHPLSYYTLATGICSYLVIISIASLPLLALLLISMTIMAYKNIRDAKLTVKGAINQQIEKERLRSELLADVSHDILKPVASIRAHLETLITNQDKTSSKSTINQEYLKIALKNTASLDKLVSDFLQLSKLENGVIKLKKEPFSLNDLISDIFQKVKLLSDKAGVKLEVYSSENLPLAYGDLNKIERAIINLLDNSIRYTRPGGTISVSIVNYIDKLSITIEDTGIGISESDLSMISQPLFRGSNVNQIDHTGHGLGLAITSKIIALHNSEFKIQSVLGVGTRVSFELPVKPDN